MRQTATMDVMMGTKGTHLTAEADAMWLLFYWGGTALNCVRCDAPFKKDHIYFAPTDDYEVREGAEGHRIRLKGYNYVEGEPPHPCDRIAHDEMIGYHFSDVFSFVSRSRDRNEIATAVAAYRLGDGQRWKVTFVDDAHGDVRYPYMDREALKRFFWATDPATLEIVSLERLEDATFVALDAEWMSNVHGGVPVGYELRPYLQIKRYADERSANTTSGREPFGSRNERKLPAEFQVA